MTPLNDIILLFEDYKFNNDHINISKCEKVINQEKFIKTTIKYLQRNKGKKLFIPYYNRLEKIYLIFKHK